MSILIIILYKVYNMENRLTVMCECIHMYRPTRTKRLTWREPLVSVSSTWSSNEYKRKGIIYVNQDDNDDHENIAPITTVNRIKRIQRIQSYHTRLCDM